MYLNRRVFIMSFTCSNFLKFSKYCQEASIFQNRQRNVKHFVFFKKNPKHHIAIEIAGQTNTHEISRVDRKTVASQMVVFPNT